jgi:hypothetical protein
VGVGSRNHTISLGSREALREIAMSQDQNHLNHATWECKYHVVFTPKYRKKLLFGQIRRVTPRLPLALCGFRPGAAESVPSIGFDSSK